MAAGIEVSLQREKIQGPMAADSQPYLQHHKKYCSMMAVRIIGLQQDKTYRRMMATDGLIHHARKIIFPHSLLCIKNGMLLLISNRNMPLL